MSRSSLEKETLGRTGENPRWRRRREKIAISLVGMGLGDRIILEAPLRMHRQNRPRDWLIGIVDRNSIPDLPRSLRRHFDELWWISTGDGREWKGSCRTVVARRVRDALMGAKVRELYVPAWKPKQFPRNRAYAMHPYNCFAEADQLRKLGVYPRLTVPRAERLWAEQFLFENIPGDHDSLVAIHVRNVGFSRERNLDPALIEQIMDCLRTRGRFAFLLLGRDDAPPPISGPNVFSFVGQKWPFERTAAIVARTRLFIGGESGLTHTAAALGVPLIGLGFVGHRARPFTAPSRYIYFQKGESPQTILAEVKAFVTPIRLAPAGT